MAALLAAGTRFRMGRQDPFDRPQPGGQPSPVGILSRVTYQTPTRQSIEGIGDRASIRADSRALADMPTLGVSVRSAPDPERSLAFASRHSVAGQGLEDDSPLRSAEGRGRCSRDHNMASVLNPGPHQDQRELGASHCLGDRCCVGDGDNRLRAAPQRQDVVETELADRGPLKVMAPFA